ncbi:MAG: diaminopimelate decarboxylase [Bacillota bacterium]
MNQRNTLKSVDGSLQIGNFKASDLAKKFGTPLYVLDIDHVEGMMKAYKKTMANYGDGEVLFASKALSTKAIYQTAKNCGIGVDVVSGGEMATAKSVDFPMEKVYFHGNNKLQQELEMAVSFGVKMIVCDSHQELATLNAIAKEAGIVQKIELRINPGVEAHTHEFIQTAKTDSKFGFGIQTGDALEAVKEALKFENLHLSGLHCHIGSQIFDFQAFLLAVSKMTDFMKEVKDVCAHDFDELNLGGGIGIYYTEEDAKFDISAYENFLDMVLSKVSSEITAKGLKKPFVTIEPGRSIVGEAGITLYTAGNIKDIKDIRKYIAIDGGMFDNPRYALYDAKYEVVNCDKMNETNLETVTIAGKCCESGDIIAKDVTIPKVETGDILAVLSTGAYNYSMASNYNRNPIPAMVGVKGENAGYIVNRQSYEDMARLDAVPEFLK